METNLKSWDQALPQEKFAYNNMFYGSMGMCSFAFVYQKVPHHLINLAQLPVGKKFINAASTIAEQVLDV